MLKVKGGLFLVGVLLFLKQFFLTFHIMFVKGYNDRRCSLESAQILMKATTETEEKLALSG